MELSETIEVIRTNIETLLQRRCLVTVVRFLPFLPMFPSTCLDDRIIIRDS